MEISIDASVLVKWFKKGEEKEDFALRLKNLIFDRRVVPIINEYVFLETIRALRKAGYPDKKIIDAKIFLTDLEMLGLVWVVKVHEVRDLAMDLIRTLNLYASDSLILATALLRKTNLITEDHHILREAVIEYAGKRGIKILTLDRLYTIIHP